MLARVLLALILSFALANSAPAAIKKTVEIDSSPAGAEVFLLRGRKETLLGTTPLKYDAEFHSNVSVLRIKLKKAGFEDLAAKISASKERFEYTLRTRSFAMAPGKQKDPKLKSMQKKINPLIDATLPGLLDKGKIDSEDVESLKVRKAGGKYYLVLPISLSKNGIDANVRKNTDLFVRQAWNRSGAVLVGPLATAVSREKRLDGILLEINYTDSKKKFKVKSKVESRVEMECQGGYVTRQVYDACATTVQVVEYYTDSNGNMMTRNAGTRCQGGMVSRSVFEQCAFRVPITKTAVKSDPTTTVSKNRYRVSYLYPFASKQGKQLNRVDFDGLSIRCRDSAGKVLLEKGQVP